MAMKIVADCINCGACEPEYPNTAITAGESIYVIDPAVPPSAWAPMTPPAASRSARWTAVS